MSSAHLGLGRAKGLRGEAEVEEGDMGEGRLGRAGEEGVERGKRKGWAAARSGQGGFWGWGSGVRGLRDFKGRREPEVFGSGVIGPRGC